MSFLILFIILLVFYLVLDQHFNSKVLSLLVAFGLTLFYVNVGLVLVSYSFSSLDRNLFLCLTGMILFMLLAYYIKNKRTKTRDRIKERSWDRLMIFSLVFIGAVFLVNLLINLYTGIVEWDSITTYDYRAKYFMMMDKITTVEPSEGYYFGVFKYPILTTSLHLLFYMFKTSHVKVLYSVFALFLAMGVGQFIYTLNKNKKISFIFGFILFFLSPFITEYSLISYTNLLFAYYYLISLLTLYLFLRSEKKMYFLVSALFLSISFWIRMEAFFYLPVNVFLIWFFHKKRRVRNILIYSAITLGIGLFWYFVIFMENGLGRNIVISIFKMGQRADALKNVHGLRIIIVFSILKYFFLFINNTNFLFIWYLFFFLVLYQFRAHSEFNSSFLLYAIGANVIMWVITWYFSYGDWAIRLSGLRTILQFYPLVFIFVIYKLTSLMPVNFIRK